MLISNMNGAEQPIADVANPRGGSGQRRRLAPSLRRLDPVWLTLLLEIRRSSTILEDVSRYVTIVSMLSDELKLRASKLLTIPSWRLGTSL